MAKKAKKPKAPLTAQQKAQQTQEERDAVQAWRDLQYSQHYRTAQENYNLRRFWDYWRKSGNQPNPPANSVTIGSAPGAETFLDVGSYERQGGNPSLNTFTNPPLRVELKHDPDKKLFTLAIDVRQYTAFGAISRTYGIIGERTKNTVSWEPKTPGEFDKHAEIKGKESVRFMAMAGFPKVTFTYADDHEFVTGLGGNIGSGSLAYTEKEVRAGLDEALLNGIEFEVSQNFLNAVGAKRDDKTLAKFTKDIDESKKNNEKKELLNKFVNLKALQDFTAKLGASTQNDIKQPDRDAFKTKIDDELKNLKKKIDDLDKKIVAEKDPAVKKALEDEKVIIKERQDSLKSGEANLKTSADDKAKTTTKDDLQALQDKLDAILDPQKQFKEALAEVKGALASVTDKTAYTDPEKKQLDAFQIKVDELEKKLANPLNDADRKSAEADLRTVMKDMKDLAATKPDFKQKCEAAVDKAEKLADGKKSDMTSAANREDRLSTLEKATAEIKNALELYQDPKNAEAIENMIIGKKSAVKWGRFERVKKGHGQQYIDSRFDALETQRNELRDLINTEKGKLDAEVNPKPPKVSTLPPTEQKQMKDRLKAVEDQLTAIDDLQKNIVKAKATRPTI